MADFATGTFKVRIQAPGTFMEADLDAVAVKVFYTLPTYTLTYTAGVDGSINGTSPETVESGHSGNKETVPNTGYHFVSWSDGILTASRTDTNVTGKKFGNSHLCDQQLHPDLHGRGRRFHQWHLATDSGLWCRWIKRSRLSRTLAITL